MAFANLFSGLSSMGEDVRSPGGAYVTSSNRMENGSRGRKRKTQREQPGSQKKRCHQIQTEDNFTSRNKSCQKQVTERERSFPGQKYNHSFNSSYNSRQHCKGQNDQTEDDCNMKKEIHQGKKIKKKYQQRHNRGAKPVSKTQEKPKFMTQEFKDQNALLVDGRLLCRHFLSGRCIKGDKCQLEHCQGYNGLIKEVCKFYVQGFCLKGESCLYLHNILSLYRFRAAPITVRKRRPIFMFFPLLSSTVVSMQVFPQEREMFARRKLQVLP
ncbi:hypothetical protein CHARACLAT_006756 [Characodon lateralis]|uniref:C3H1-type domain-containing protein n=1 Tax=Characodon lateralis TaxID=208331 RepID=A0ABU7CPJ1_9TELE|nr:hypothetical protein [Characodon lateralis]